MITALALQDQWYVLCRCGCGRKVHPNQVKRGQLYFYKHRLREQEDVLIQCPQCGIEYKPYHISGYFRGFCSKKCRYLHSGNLLKVWVPSKEKPGWGRYEYDQSTTRMCHEWIPMNRILNVSDYNAEDYKMFLCDRSLRGKYLEWAQYLLIAEDWCRRRAKGIPPEKDERAQVKK